MHRTTVEIPEPQWRVLQTLADAKGTTVIDEIRAALDAHMVQAAHPSIAAKIARRHLQSVDGESS